MSRITPKPIIARVAQTWEAGMGMKIALVEDMERNVWVVESCPAGTHFWTLAQAQDLIHGGRTGQALRTAVTMGRALNASALPQMLAVSASAPQPLAPRPSERMERRGQAVPAGVTRPLRQAMRRTTKTENKTAVCA